MKDLKSYLPTFSLAPEEVYAYKFTVFVPVYNAEKTIDKVFKSLENQLFKDFEVIMINDGSKDKSNELIERALQNTPLNIRYVNNPVNKNKMGIFLQAIDMAKGELFAVHDSDDEIVPEALQSMLSEYDAVPDNKKEKISGIACCCQDQFGNRIGDLFEPQPFYSNAFVYSNIHKIGGEKWGINRTRILKSIKANPEIFGRGLIPESFLWLTLASQGYETKFINDTFRIYYLDVEDSLSTSSYEKKALGMVIIGLIFINEFYKDYLFKIPIVFIKRAFSLLKASVYLDFTFMQYWRSIDSGFIRLFLLCLWPFRKLI